MRDGKKANVKFINKKKINTYTKEECEKEIHRLEKAVDEKSEDKSSKSGIQTNSKYYRDVQNHLMFLINSGKKPIKIVEA